MASTHLPKDVIDAIDSGTLTDLRLCYNTWFRPPSINAVAEDGTTALMLASEKGRHDMVEWLCNMEADLDAAKKKDGFTALMIASEKGHLNIVRELCKRGVDVDQPNKEERTALHIASKNGHFLIVKMLIVSKA